MWKKILITLIIFFSFIFSGFFLYSVKADNSTKYEHITNNNYVNESTSNKSYPKYDNMKSNIEGLFYDSDINSTIIEKKYNSSIKISAKENMVLNENSKFYNSSVNEVEMNKNKIIDVVENLNSKNKIKKNKTSNKNLKFKDKPVLEHGLTDIQKKLNNKEENNKNKKSEKTSDQINLPILNSKSNITNELIISDKNLNNKEEIEKNEISNLNKKPIYIFNRFCHKNKNINKAQYDMKVLCIKNISNEKLMEIIKENPDYIIEMIDILIKLIIKFSNCLKLKFSNKKYFFKQLKFNPENFENNEMNRSYKFSHNYIINKNNTNNLRYFLRIKNKYFYPCLGFSKKSNKDKFKLLRSFIRYYILNIYYDDIQLYNDYFLKMALNYIFETIQFKKITSKYKGKIEIRDVYNYIYLKINNN